MIKKKTGLVLPAAFLVNNLKAMANEKRTTLSYKKKIDKSLYLELFNKSLTVLTSLSKQKRKKKKKNTQGLSPPPSFSVPQKN
jgi:hypothetical protein